MTYFCFIEKTNSSVPHMEALSVADVTEAEAAARDLMRQHQSVIVAHVFEGDRLLRTFTADDQISPSAPPLHASKPPSGDKPRA